MWGPLSLGGMGRGPLSLGGMVSGGCGILCPLKRGCPLLRGDECTIAMRSGNFAGFLFSKGGVNGSIIGGSE